MKSYIGKIVFIAGVILVALVSRVFYAKVYATPTGTPTDDSANGHVPAFILPSLSAVAMNNDAISPGGDLESGSASGTSLSDAGGSVSAAVAPNISASAGTVVPMGLVAGSTFSRVGTASAPAIDAEAFVVADLTTGTPFLELNANKRWPMASITKLMTASIVLDKLSLTQDVTVTADAFAADPSEKILRSGDVYTVADLLRVMLLPSSNVAAETLADAYGRDAFIAEMNARAARWGMVNTHYDDPSGLSVANQSTPTDLLVLAQKIDISYPQVLAITRTPQVIVTEINSGKQSVVKSINSFAGEADFVGGKTGYTDQANGNLLSLFSHKGHTIFVIVLGTDDSERFANTETLYNWFTANFK